MLRLCLQVTNLNLNENLMLSAHLHIASRQREASKGGGEDGEDRIQIPLQDVVRFKERQWFIEEVEVCAKQKENGGVQVDPHLFH